MAEKQPEQGPKHSVSYHRHGPADYRSYADRVASNTPEAPIHRDEQLVPDLRAEGGREFVEAAAEAFFNDLSPEDTDLIFFSSDQVRALETAQIYKEVGKKRGFTVLNPGAVRGTIANQIGEGEIRTLKNLSLAPSNTFVDTIFNPRSQRPPANLDAVPQDVREKWEEACAIIDADDRGSWGANLFHHGEEMKNIFPEIRSSLDLYNREFQNLVRLAKFGIEKADASGHPKNVKIMSFGHENYMGYALDRYFHDHTIRNCESVTIDVDETGLPHMSKNGTRVPLTGEESPESTT